MSTNLPTRAVTVLRIYCPIDAATMWLMLSGDASALERDATLAAMLAVVRGDNPLGDFGLYRSVVEIAPGWESFTPGDAARPAMGAAGTNTVSPTAILTVHIAADAPADMIDGVLAAILAAHPWEVPVIEIGEARLLIRS